MKNREVMGILGAAAFGLAAQSLDAPAEAAQPHEKIAAATPHKEAAVRRFVGQQEMSKKLDDDNERNDEKPFSLARCFSPDRLSDESAELKALFTANPKVADKYFDLVDHLQTTQLPDGSTHFAVPGTDFNLTLSVVPDNGKSWISCDGVGCIEYGESWIDGEMQLTQVGLLATMGTGTESLESIMDGPSAVEDFQKLLAGYARANLYGASTRMAEADTSAGNEIPNSSGT